MEHEQGDGFVIVSMSGHGNEARERTKAPLPEVVHPDVVRDPAALSGEPTCNDLAALLSVLGAAVYRARAGEGPHASGALHLPRPLPRSVPPGPRPAGGKPEVP
jgi:hypothetical protein